MSTTVVEAVVDRETLAAVLVPRDGVIAEDLAEGELAGGGPSGQYRYALADGPLAAYRRTVSVTAAPAGGFALRQEVQLRVGLWVWSWLFALPLRRALGRLDPPSAHPWWAPPQRVDRTGATNLAALCTLSVVIGYLDTLVPQTMTYVGAEYHVGTTGQGVALGVVQVSALVAIAALMVADRRGRRPLALGCVVGALVFAGVGALAPSLNLLVASQVVADGLGGAGYLLVIVVAAEEMPAGGRAWAAGVISLCFGVGSGIALLFLPLAEVGPGGWRWLYAVALLGLPVVAACARHLGESRRFREPAQVQHDRMSTRRLRGLSAMHRRRLLLFGTTAVLFGLFFTPASEFQNQYLRTQRHFSAFHISVLSQIAGTVGGVAVIVGGRLADTWGRRPVAAMGVAVGTAAGVFSYLSGGWALWTWVTLGSVMSYGVAPALSVYGPELFPSGVRSTAAGVLGALGAAGGVVGLLAAAGLSDAIGTIGPALGVLAVGPALMVALVVVAYPETARRPLEALNPSSEERAAQ